MYGVEKNTIKINTNIIFFWVINNKIKTHDRHIGVVWIQMISRLRFLCFFFKP